MMELSVRLKAIADLVDNSKCALDVGCDHAYLPIYLVENGKALTAIASDNKIGPLERAIKNVKIRGLESKIKCVLSDGLEKIEDEYDYLIIAGMGGEMISSILKDRDIKKSVTLILEPNRNQKELREFLESNGYSILDEFLINDLDIIYPIIKCVKTDKIHKLSIDEIKFGPIILKKRPIELFIEIDRLIKELERGIEFAKDKESLNDRIKELRRIRNAS